MMIFFISEEESLDILSAGKCCGVSGAWLLLKPVQHKDSLCLPVSRFPCMSFFDHRIIILLLPGFHVFMHMVPFVL